MDESASGWTFGKILGLIVGVVGMAGFGLCSSAGLILGVTSGGLTEPLVLLFVVLGFLLTWQFFLLARRMIRRASGQDP